MADSPDSSRATGRAVRALSLACVVGVLAVPAVATPLSPAGGPRTSAVLSSVVRADDPVPAPSATNAPPANGATPSPTPTPPPPPVIPVDLAAANAQCPLGAGRPLSWSTELARANAIMSGRVQLGNYGSFNLGSNPYWGRQSGLDASGNANIHGLDWLLPLLRVGVASSNPAMIDRFYGVLFDWLRDNKPRGLSATGAYSQLPEGYRLVVLTCAVAGPHGDAAWVRAGLRSQAELVARANRWNAYNNTAVYQSLGLFAAAEALGRTDLRSVADKRMQQIARLLLRPDGSDREGAVGYADGGYRQFTEAKARYALAGLQVPASIAAVDAIPTFLAWATRPDGRVEALGDTSPNDLADRYGDNPFAAWAASQGKAGTAPKDLFKTFAGGYAFGRSGWGTQRPFDTETFWSMRYRTPGPTVHAHADAGSVTLSALGSQLLFDTGQYGYSYNSKRTYIRSRPAHNVVVSSTGSYSLRNSSVPLADSSDTGDTVTVIDPGYSGATITRTVHYDRPGGFLVVWDTATTSTARTWAQHWQLGRDRQVRVTNTPDGPVAATTGTGPNLSLRWVGPSPAQVTVSRGATNPLLGWNSQKYGELVPAPTVAAKTWSPAGSTTSWLTVIAPRGASTNDSDLVVRGMATRSAATVAVRTPSGDRVLTMRRKQAPTTLSEATALISAPTDGTLLNATDAALRWTDLPGTARKHRVVVDGAPALNAAAGDTTATIGLKDGYHKVQVDTLAGSTMVPGPPVTVQVDTTAPVLLAGPTLWLRRGTVGQSLTSAATYRTTIPLSVGWYLSDRGYGASGLAAQNVLGRAVSLGKRVQNLYANTGRDVLVGITGKDRAGNARTYNSRQPGPSVDLVGPAEGTAGWATSRGGSWLGGTAAVATKSGTATTFRVTGRGLGVVSSTSAKQGNLAVYVDGKKITTLDLRSRTSAHRQVVWSHTWSKVGTRTVTLVAQTSKSRPTVVLDGLVTLPK